MQSSEILKTLKIYESKPKLYYEKMAYRLCKREYPGIIKMAKLILKRTANNYDNQVSIEGVTGSGKSMYTLNLILVIHYLLRRTFRITKQCLFIPDEGEIRKSVRNLKDLDVYWIDEAIRALDKKKWQNQDQQELNHIVKTERYKRNTIFYNMQRFAEFTESFRNSNIYFRIIIIPRYAAVLRVFDIDPDIEDPWHTRETKAIKFKQWGRTRYQAVASARERLKRELKAPNFHMYSLFPNLEDNEDLKIVWTVYNHYKRDSRVKERERAKQGIKPLTHSEKRYRDELKAVIKSLWERGKIKNSKDARRVLGANLGDGAYLTMFNEIKEDKKFIEKTKIVKKYEHLLNSPLPNNTKLEEPLPVET